MTSLGDEVIPRLDHATEDLGGVGLGAGDRSGRKVLDRTCKAGGKAETKTRGDLVKNRAPGASSLHLSGASTSASLMMALLWFLVASSSRLVAAGQVRSDSIQLAGIHKSFGTPRGLQTPAGIQPVWFEAWKLVLHNQIDGLLSAIAQRPTEDSSRPEPEPGPEQGPKPSQQLGEGSNVDFKIDMVGDSTMRMQAKALALLLMQRGELTCAGASEDGVNIICSKPASFVREGGASQLGVPGVTISIRYVKAIESCQAAEVDADFVYFGCGLRLLQLIPDRHQSPAALDTWVHYERSLEEAVLYYRSGGVRGGGRVPVGEAFMTTHSFADEVLDGQYEIRVREYQEEKESLLATCRRTVDQMEPVHADWESGYEPEDICTHGTFDEAGVLDLNRRAEPVMSRLDVPMVRAYDITQGQLWATLPEDGRHYPAMIPVELNSFLSEITTALRKEKRESYSGPG